MIEEDPNSIPLIAHLRAEISMQRNRQVRRSIGLAVPVLRSLAAKAPACCGTGERRNQDALGRI
jgi:hypothetical protein